MKTRTMLAIAASSTLLAMSMPLAAQDTQSDTTMETPAPPEVPADPAPTEAPQPSTPTDAPAPPASPPPPMAGSMNAPGTTPGMQNTNMTNPPPAPQASYPRCSATVTDQCQQSSAREADYKGGPPANRRRPRRR